MDYTIDNLRDHYRARIADAYEECACWADWPTDEDGDESDASLSKDAADLFAADVAAFLSDDTIADALVLWWRTFGPEQIGHDLWLTRNGHGAGFWDRDYSGGVVTAAGKVLTDAAHALGSCDLYDGGDGWVYAS